MTPRRRYYRGRNLVTMRDVAAGQNYVYHFDHQGTGFPVQHQIPAYLPVAGAYRLRAAGAKHDFGVLLTVKDFGT